MLKIFSEKENEVKLSQLNIETATDEQIKKACESATWVEIRSRIESLSKNIRNLPPSRLDETPEEKGARIRELNRKLTLLRQCLTEKEQEEKMEREQNELKFSETTALQELQNVRFSYDSIILMMRSRGTEAIPLNSVKWQKPETPIIEIRCLSGRTRLLDLTKLPAQWWKLLTETRFSPLYIVAESAGLQRTPNTLESLWVDNQEFHGEDKIVPFDTVLAIMLV